MNCIAIIGGTSSSLNNENIKSAAKEIGKKLSVGPNPILICGIRHGVIGIVLNSITKGSAPYQAIVLRGDEEREMHPNIAKAKFFDFVSERKDFIANNSQVVFALPGGLGTFDEIISFLTKMGKLKKIILINIDGYYNPLLTQLSNMAYSGLIRPKVLESIQTCSNARAAIDVFNNNNYLLLHSSDK